jgi:mannose-1-phosphate guanylyltransferase/mannose-6-phosphate isomerase
VLSQEHGDQVKQLVDQLKTENRREAGEHKLHFSCTWAIINPSMAVNGIKLKELSRSPENDCLCRNIFIAPEALDCRARHGRGWSAMIYGPILFMKMNQSYLPIGWKHRLTQSWRDRP